MPGRIEYDEADLLMLMADRDDFVPIEVADVSRIEVWMHFFPNPRFAFGRSAQRESPAMELTDRFATRGDEGDIRAIADRRRPAVDRPVEPEGVDSQFVLGSVSGARFGEPTSLVAKGFEDPVVEFDRARHVGDTEDDVAQHVFRPIHTLASSVVARAFDRLQPARTTQARKAIRDIDPGSPVVEVEVELGNQIGGVVDVRQNDIDLVGVLL